MDFMLPSRLSSAGSPALIRGGCVQPRPLECQSRSCPGTDRLQARSCRLVPAVGASLEIALLPAWRRYCPWVNALHDDQAFRFAGWPNDQVPRRAAGVYTVWRQDEFSISGRNGARPSTSSQRCCRSCGSSCATRASVAAAGTAIAPLPSWSYSQTRWCLADLASVPPAEGLGLTYTFRGREAA